MGRGSATVGVAMSTHAADSQEATRSIGRTRSGDSWPMTPPGCTCRASMPSKSIRAGTAMDSTTLNGESVPCRGAGRRLVRVMSTTRTDVPIVVHASASTDIGSVCSLVPPSGVRSQRG